MGVEVAGTDMPQVAVDTKTDIDNSFLHEKENGKLDNGSGFNHPIKFGSHEEEPAKGETNNVSDSNLPKDAVDEWPASKQVHRFYFVRVRPYDDPKIKAKIEQADKEIQKTNQPRSRLTDELKAKRSERAELKSQVRALVMDSKKYVAILDEKKKEMGPLQQALGKLNVGRGGLCSSEEELNDVIYSLQYRIQHESIPLSEEKQILREIKQLEGTRAKVIANAAVRAKIEDSLGQKEAIQDQVKLMGVDLDGVRKEQQAVSSKINQLDEKVKALEAEIEVLQGELDAVTKKKDLAYESIRELRAQRDEGNALFYQCRTLLNQVKELAAKKDIKALEELCNAEVEKFMSLWSGKKSFRDDYERRILLSLDSRQLSRDGRIRNPDEKPLLAPEVHAEPEPFAKVNAKRLKEDLKPTPQKDTSPTHKVWKESSKKESTATVENAGINDNLTSEPEKQQQKTSEPEKQQQKTSEPEKQQQKPSAEKVVDEAKLKELKREEEIAKAKQAMERKKKLAEKAAAKAAVKAQKEAEKKLKEREKKLKKKASASAPANDPEEPAEAVSEVVAEPENVELQDEAPAPAKEKVRSREKAVKHRSRPKGGEPLPRSILRKRKSTNYWIWAAAAAAAALVLLFLVLGYFYIF